MAANSGRPHILDAGRLFNRFRSAIEGMVRTIEGIEPSVHKVRATSNGKPPAHDQAMPELVAE
jgi:hypothetical protein